MKPTSESDDLEPEYDIKSLRLRRTGPGRKAFGSLVALEPDVAAVFDSPEAVNAALRFLIKVTRDNAPKETGMPFVTYENRRNPHATVHKAGCRQIAKNGGKHKYGQGSYKEHETLTNAEIYAQSTGLPVIYCSFCAPQGQALAGSAAPHAA